MEYDKAHKNIIEKLSTDLPRYITYHDVDHTLYVIRASIYLAEKEGVTGEELLLLKTAALYHDTGFLISHIEHEQSSCVIAKKELVDYGYTDSQIEQICTMIMATRLPQQPKNHLSEILCDADLFYLGGNHYDEYAEKLFHEFKSNSILETETEWIEMQFNFLNNHNYFTKTAQKTLNSQKIQNLIKIKDLYTSIM